MHVNSLLVITNHSLYGGCRAMPGGNMSVFPLSVAVLNNLNPYKSKQKTRSISEAPVTSIFVGGKWLSSL